MEAMEIKIFEKALAISLSFAEMQGRRPRIMVRNWGHRMDTIEELGNLRLLCRYGFLM